MWSFRGCFFWYFLRGKNPQSGLSPSLILSWLGSLGDYVITHIWIRFCYCFYRLWSIFFSRIIFFVCECVFSFLHFVVLRSESTASLTLNMQALPNLWVSFQACWVGQDSCSVLSINTLLLSECDVYSSEIRDICFFMCRIKMQKIAFTNGWASMIQSWEGAPGCVVNTGVLSCYTSFPVSLPFFFFFN